jgi:hypothetical protein
MKKIQNGLLLTILITVLYSCQKDQVKTTTYFDYGSFITNGLIAYYPLNGDVNDLSGNGLNGIAHKVSYGPDRFGHQDRAGFFNGIDSYIEIENSEFLNGNTYTICFWFKADLNDTLQQSFISKSDQSGDGFTIGVTSDNFFSHLYFENGMAPYWSLCKRQHFRSKYRRSDLDHEIVFEFAAVAFSEIAIIDYFGRTEARCRPGIFFNSNEHNLFIGRSDNGEYKNYKGELDDLIIYNRILSYDEIKKLSKWHKYKSYQ